jgi:hypothetical protein
MALKTGTRIGGRGCVACGSHNTEGHGKAGSQWCNTCGHKWLPCQPGCRGYHLDIRDKRGPIIKGCPECGVPDHIALWWPEAWRAMSLRLGEVRDKLDAVE